MSILRIIRRNSMAAAGVTSICFLVSLGAQNLSPTVLQGIVVDGRGGTPMAGVTVTLTTETGSDQVALTDNLGRFRIEELVPGEYSLTLVQPGFVKAPPTRIRLLGGGASEDMLRLQMIPTASSSGQVFGDRDQPVPSATVVALRVHYDDLGRQVLLPPGAGSLWLPGAASTGAEVVTDDRGEYRLFNLEPGVYHVAVRAGLDRELADEIVPVEYYPGVVDPGNSIPLTVLAGADLRATDIRLSGAAVYSILFEVADVPCTASSGFERFHIARRDRSGIIVVGDSVLLPPARVPDFLVQALGPLPSRASPFSRTGDGSWVARPFYPGSYEIRYSSCNSTVQGSLSVDIVDGDVDAGVLNVGTGSTLTASVSVVSEFRGRLEADRLGFSLLPLDSVPPDWLPSIGTTFPLFPELDRDGAPYLAGMTIPPGRYLVRPVTLGQDAYLASLSFNGRNVLESAIEISSLGGRLELVFDGPGGIVQGKVENLSGDPGPNSQIVLLPESPLRVNPNLFRVASSDQTGTFVIRAVPPGAYSVMAWENVEPNAWLDPAFLRGLESRAEAVDVENGAVNNVLLTAIPRE